MQQFMIETALLLLAAFLIGAMIGCLLRSLIFAATAPKAVETVEPESTALVSAAGLEEEEAPSDVISAAHGYTQMAKFIDEFPFPVRAVAAASVAAPVIAEIVSEPEPETVVEPEPSVEEPEQVAAVVEEVAPVVDTPEVEAELMPPVAAAQVASDDLTLIKGIDSNIADTLGSLGFGSYEQLANLLPGDVAKINSSLSADALVERSNWIEQAKILASGALTGYAKLQKDGGEAVVSQEEIAAPSAVDAPSADNDNDDDAGDDGSNGGAGPVSFGGGSSSAEENGGGSLAKSGAAIASLAGVAAAALMSGSDDDGDDDDDVPSSVVDLSGDAEADFPMFFTGMSGFSQPQRPGKRRRVFSGAGGFFVFDDDLDDLASDYTNRPVRRRKIRRSPEVALDMDDLKKISSIGVVMEKKLNGLGIKRYEQLALLPKEDLEMIGNKLSVSKTVDVNAWAREAEKLASEGY